MGTSVAISAMGALSGTGVWKDPATTGSTNTITDAAELLFWTNNGLKHVQGPLFVGVC